MQKNHKSSCQEALQKMFIQCKNGLDQKDFVDLLTSPSLTSILQKESPNRRSRIYTSMQTVWAFVSQVLNADRSCQAIVNHMGVQRIAEKKPRISGKTGAYCVARQRLPFHFVVGLMREFGRSVAAAASPMWRWRGHRLILIDGTTLSMPDTAKNQKKFPQPASQKPGLGFPLARLVGIIDLAAGAVLDVAIGPCKGKRASEHELFREMLHHFTINDLVIADRYYCSYWLIAALQKRGANIIVQQHAQRKIDFRKGKRLGQRDHIVVWQRPKKPLWMSADDYNDVPETLNIREFKIDKKVIVTTLYCPKSAPRAELAMCHKRRWSVELTFRDLKTTMGMEVLRCKSPEMIEKEIHIYMLAHNMIRLLMVNAAQKIKKNTGQISFKHSLQCWQAVQRWPLFSDADRIALLELIGQIVVGNRPGRIEPRAVKRRPKPHPLLTKPRSEAREDVRKYGHPKKQK